MKVYLDHFDDLHLTECDYSSFKPGKNLTEIRVASGLIFMPEHPAHAIYGENGPPARLVFRNVSKYEASFDPYLKTQKDNEFGPRRLESSDWDSEDLGQQEEFTVEGVLLGQPSAWMQMDILAQSFELHLED